MTFELSSLTLLAVKNTSPNQTWAFVLTSRAKNAIVTEAHISFDTAKRAAREIGGCMRVGHIQDGKAHTV